MGLDSDLIFICGFFFEALGILTVFDIFKKRKYSFRRLNILLAIVYSTSSYIYIDLIGNSLINAILGLAFFYIVSLIFYKSKMLFRFMQIVLFFIFTMIVFLPGIKALIIIFHLPEETFFGEGEAYVFCFLFIKVFIYLLMKSLQVFMLYRKKDEEIKINNKETALLFITAFLIFISVMVLAWNAYFDREFKTENIIGIFFLVAVTGLLIINIRVFSKKQRHNEKRFIYQQNMNEQSIKSLEEAYNTNENIYHIYQQQMHELKNRLIKDNAFSESDAEEMLKIPEDILSYYTKSARTNHPVIDTILKQKYFEALKLGIDMQFDIDDLTGITINEQDSITLFTDLIEYVLLRASSEKEHNFVRLRIKLEEKRFIVSIKYFDKFLAGEKKDINPILNMLKKNVRLIAEKYSGGMEIRNNGNYVYIVVLINMNKL